MGCRPACLPLDAQTSLFAAWAGVLSRAGCDALRVITSGGSGEDDVLEAIAKAKVRFPEMSILRAVEGSSHRGTGGLLRDAASELGLHGWVLFIEPHCLPPTSLAPILDSRTQAPMAVGIASDDAPAGVTVIRSELLEHAPRIGYHDFKEQFVPLQVTRGIRILAVRVASTGLRLHDRRAYLAAVQSYALLGGPRVHPAARVHETAQILGASVVAADAQVGAGAIVHESVIAEHAAVGERAVVARSVVPRGFRVAPRSLVVDRILDEESSDAADEVLALGISGEDSRASSLLPSVATSRGGR